MHEIFNFEKLYLAYLACRKGKRRTIDALKFEWDLEKNILLLEKELLSKEYKPGRSICFVVTEPVVREIIAGSFRDRVVQHLLIREIESIGESKFIFDSYSCRKGKGTHFGVRRLKKFIAKNDKNKYYAKLDISGFFMSIDHNILYFLFKKLIGKKKKSFRWKTDILWLAKTIIFHNPIENYITKGDRSLFSLVPFHKCLFHSGEQKGIPIGNYSSQFLANLYLNELDQFVKRKLNCKYYLRYVDDVVILADNKEKLKIYRDDINSFLKKNLQLELNTKKTVIQPVKYGVDFLGYFLKQNCIFVRKRVVNKFKKNLFAIKGLDCTDNKKILAMINSYFGHFRHADSYNLRKHIYKNKLGVLKSKFSTKKEIFFLECKR